MTRFKNIKIIKQSNIKTNKNHNKKFLQKKLIKMK